MAMATGDEKITKLDLAKEAGHLVVDLLDERNEVGVQSWDTEFIWDVPMRSARDKGAIHHAIATIKAGGGTDGYRHNCVSSFHLFLLPRIPLAQLLFERSIPSWLTCSMC